MSSGLYYSRIYSDLGDLLAINVNTVGSLIFLFEYPGIRWV